MCFALDLETALVDRHYFGAAKFIRNFQKRYEPDDKVAQQLKAIQEVQGLRDQAIDALLLQKYSEHVVSRNSRQMQDSRKEELWKIAAKTAFRTYCGFSVLANKKFETLPSGPLSREHIAMIQEERWKAQNAGLPSHLLLDNYVESCRRYGGCCARKCGCCTRPRANTPFEGDVYSHCGSAPYCICCIRVYGFRYRTMELDINDPDNWETASEADDDGDDNDNSDDWTPDMPTPATSITECSGSKETWRDTPLEVWALIVMFALGALLIMLPMILLWLHILGYIG
jgi:hypothetical protein